MFLTCPTFLYIKIEFYVSKCWLFVWLEREISVKELSRKRLNWTIFLEDFASIKATMNKYKKTSEKSFLNICQLWGSEINGSIVIARFKWPVIQNRWLKKCTKCVRLCEKAHWYKIASQTFQGECKIFIKNINIRQKIYDKNNYNIKKIDKNTTELKIFNFDSVLYF